MKNSNAFEQMKEEGFVKINKYGNLMQVIPVNRPLTSKQLKSQQARDLGLNQVHSIDQDKKESTSSIEF